MGVERPEQMIDYLALVGDASDNIPGCAGIGPVTATKLISEFGSVDNLLASVDKLKGVTKTKVETSADNIKLSYFLAKICKSVPVDFEEENCKVENPNLDELLKLFSDYELKSLLKNILQLLPIMVPFNSLSLIHLPLSNQEKINLKISAT